MDFTYLFRVGLKSHTVLIAGDVARRGALDLADASISRADQMDARSTDKDQRTCLIRGVITVRSLATWWHRTRRSRGAWTTDHDQRHVRINKEL